LQNTSFGAKVPIRLRNRRIPRALRTPHTSDTGDQYLGMYRVTIS